MLRNLLVTTAFCGTRYHGFQVQKNALTICEVFQDAVEKVFGVRYDIKGCSRTDAGVHANMYCISMRVDHMIPCDKLVIAFNNQLPNDVAVLSISDAPHDFHARYSCKEKQYIYKIHNSAIKDPFAENLMYKYPYPLDEKVLNKEARDFVGTHDFTSFCSIRSDVPDNTRTVSEFTVSRQGACVLFTVAADGFLYNMARIMVGTLLFIAMGKIERGAVPGIIKAKNRNLAGKTMPPHGLYLNRVYY